MVVVLITGCSSGFGLAAAIAFAQQGDTVIATMRNPDKAGALRAAADAVGAKLEVIQLDVTDEAAREHVVEEALARHGQIDVLVNNAGIYEAGAAEELGEASLRRHFETNVFAAFGMIHAVLPGMRKRKAGRIVNISSVVSLFAPPFEASYAATKHALDALSISIDLELQPFNVRVVQVSPGTFATGLSGNAVRPPAESVYGSAPADWYKIWEGMLASNPDYSAVTAAIVEAATAPEPLPRYIVPGSFTTDAIVALGETKNALDLSMRGLGVAGGTKPGA